MTSGASAISGQTAMFKMWKLRTIAKENTMTQKSLDPIPPGEIFMEEFM